VTDVPEPEAAPPELWQEVQPVLDQELGRLPAKYRAVVLLCDLQGKTRKEAARELCCPEGTVAGWLARARSMLAKRLARHGVVLSAGALAAALSQDGASAGVPPSLTCSTIKAAGLVAAGQAAAGVVSVPVAALTEGVLKSMFLTKLKIAAVVLVLACLAAGATGFACRAWAGQQPSQIPEPAPSAPGSKEPRDLEKELRKARAEVERLRKENADLKDRLQKLGRAESGEEVKLTIKVYPVVGLTSQPVVEGTEAQSLLRVLTNTVEPASWSQMGGPGSVEYFPEGVSLVIRQTADVHKQVQDLLDALRKSKREQEKAVGNQAPGQ
jgi:hypothetical protein